MPIIFVSIVFTWVLDLTMKAKVADDQTNLRQPSITTEVNVDE